MKTIAYIFSLFLFINVVLSDFHVLQGIAPGGGTGMEACPSNYYNCKCWKNGDRAARVADIKGKGIADIAGRDYFRIDKGLCGMGQLDFYKRSSGVWEFYVNKGNGELQGTCYENKAGNNCDGFFFFDKLVCYSYICGH